MATTQKKSAESGDDTAKKSTSSTSSTAKSTTKKTSTKKAASKSPAKKTTKNTTKKAAKKSSRSGSAPRAESRPQAKASEVASSAARELLALTGKQAEGITGLDRTDDGWTVQVEVVEVRRIPDTTDVLALYEVTTDRQGNLEGYRRVRRYARGVPGDD